MSDPIADLERELLAAADRTQARARHRARTRLLAAVAALAIVAAVALLSFAPWRESPSFLERAHAALVADSGVLHATWSDTTTSTDPPCTVTRGPNEIWIDETPPYRYRALLYGFGFPPGPESCSNAGATEIGGTFDPLETVVFEPPFTLRESSLLFNMPPDPVRVLREALARGSAHDEGEAELNGRRVRRIRVDPLPGCPIPSCADEPTYVYVDPDTFRPVEIAGPAFGERPVRIVVRYPTFEYLPRTAANLALTDIRAQHPDATVP
jgi:hypothetical protein